MAACASVPRVLLSILLGVFLIAGAATDPARAEQPPTPPPAQIIVIGTGNVSAAPDYADINCGVTSKAKTAKDATDANSRAMSAIEATLRGAGIEQKDIQTSRFSLQPVYAPPQPNTEPRLTGFSVTNRFSVTIRKTDQVGDILDRLIAAGATDIGGIEFRHNDPSKLLDAAREAAIADARRQAEAYARAAGLTLGAIVLISEESGRPLPFAPQGALRAAAAVPVAIGEDSLAVHATVGFDLAH